MSKLIINDLEQNRDLDRAAAMKICGGGLSWAVARDMSSLSSARRMGSAGVINVSNTFVEYNYTVLQNPNIFNVYNGAGNSGTIVNSFDVMTISAGSNQALIESGS